MTYATADDVIARWGKDSADVDTPIATLITTRLADVERMIKRRFKNAVPARDLDDDITNGVVDAEDVKQVEADAVLRLARNPDGYVQEADGNYSYMLSQSLAEGVLEIQPAEWYTLGLVNDGMFVIVPTAVVST